VEGAEGVFAVRRLADDGHEAWAEVLRRGLEGFVGKDPTSTYRSGGRTRAWLKSKVRRDGQFIVGGIVQTREGWSLLVGSTEGGKLIYRGLVHFGVGRKLAEALMANGLVRSTSPFSEKVPLTGYRVGFPPEAPAHFLLLVGLGLFGVVSVARARRSGSG
jgi:ATP-dependent DNA ligase